MRKTSSHSDGAANNDPKVQEVAVEKGTIHTKRHAKNDDDDKGWVLPFAFFVTVYTNDNKKS